MPRCIHCPQPAYLPTFIIPALCEGHADLLRLTTWLEAQGRSTTLVSVQAFAAHFPQLDLTPIQIETLYTALPDTKGAENME